jgi:uncharacterized protein YecT (DUF1311 family)
MEVLKRLIFFFATIVLISSISAHAQTQPELTQNACSDYKKADEELNRVYNQILATYKDDGEFILKLKKAQRAWVVFRDLHLESIYPKADEREYGSVKPMCSCLISAKLTIDRTGVLKQWLTGAVEGDSCAGSIRLTRDLQRQKAMINGKVHQGGKLRRK